MKTISMKAISTFLYVDKLRDKLVTFFIPHLTKLDRCWFERVVNTTSLQISRAVSHKFGLVLGRFGSTETAQPNLLLATFERNVYG